MFKLIALATKRLILALKYRLSFLFRITVSPLFINFPVTYRCNAKCIMCNIWKKYNTEVNGCPPFKTVNEELKAQDVECFIQKNKAFFSDLKSIGFTGGEAFLRKDIVDIIRIVHKELPYVDIGVQTNGLLPELIKDKIKEILAFYPGFKMAVSLDGVGDTHDRIRGIAGAYEKAIQTINYAQELGVTGITCGMTLTPLNYNKITELAETVESLGCEFSCFLPEKSEYFGNAGDKQQLTQEQLRIIAEQLKSFSCHYFMDNLRLQISGIASRSLPCYSGYTSYVIDPFGGIFPCILREDSFGNIKDGLFKDLVSSAKAWQLRDNLKGCKCWCQCEVSTSVVSSPFDAVKWFIMNKNKKEILKTLNKKTLIRRL